MRAGFPIEPVSGPVKRHCMDACTAVQTVGGIYLLPLQKALGGGQYSGSQNKRSAQDVKRSSSSGALCSIRQLCQHDKQHHNGASVRALRSLPPG